MIRQRNLKSWGKCAIRGIGAAFSVEEGVRVLELGWYSLGVKAQNSWAGVAEIAGGATSQVLMKFAFGFSRCWYIQLSY